MLYGIYHGCPAHPSAGSIFKQAQKTKVHWWGEHQHLRRAISWLISLNQWSNGRQVKWDLWFSWKRKDVRMKEGNFRQLTAKSKVTKMESEWQSKWSKLIWWGLIHYGVWGRVKSWPPIWNFFALSSKDGISSLLLAICGYRTRFWPVRYEKKKRGRPFPGHAFKGSRGNVMFTANISLPGIWAEGYSSSGEVTR